MPVKNAREYDGKIRELSAQGLKIREIAERLNLSRSVVHDRRQSMGIAGKKENYETNIESYVAKPLVQRRCPSCGCKHMTHPATWTCISCREDRDGVDTSVWTRGPRQPVVFISIS